MDRPIKWGDDGCVLVLRFDHHDWLVLAYWA